MLVITTNCDRTLADFKAAHPTVVQSFALVGLIKSFAVEFYIPTCFGGRGGGGRTRRRQGKTTTRNEWKSAEQGRKC